MAHHTLFEHVKFRRLIRTLAIPRAHAVGHLECLWNYVATHHFTGDISTMSDADIEVAAEWDGTPGAFLAACIADGRGFIDRDQRGTLVHDWQDWCSRAIKARIARAAVDEYAHGVTHCDTTCPAKAKAKAEAKAEAKNNSDSEQCAKPSATRASPRASAGGENSPGRTGAGTDRDAGAIRKLVARVGGDAGFAAAVAKQRPPPEVVARIVNELLAVPDGQIRKSRAAMLRSRLRERGVKI